MRSLALALGLAACGRIGPGDPPIERVDLPPVISNLSLKCDGDRAEWRLRVETAGWAGEAQSDWTVNGSYLERHRLDSLAFEEDGSFEELGLDLDIVSDWRQQGRGSTAFSCAAEPDIVVVVFDDEGEAVDCRVIGPWPERWANLPQAGQCDVQWTSTTKPDPTKADPN